MKLHSTIYVQTAQAFVLIIPLNIFNKKKKKNAIVAKCTHRFRSEP